MKIYIAVDIGCIECGESSELIGVYATAAEADSAAAAHAGADADGVGSYGFFTGGQHRTEVFEATAPTGEADRPADENQTHREARDD